MKKFALLITISLALFACNNTVNSNQKQGADYDKAPVVETPSSESSTENSTQKEELNEKQAKANSCFVKGVSNYKLYKPSDDSDNNGVTFIYKGRDLKINMFDYQIGLYAQLIDEYGEKTDLGYEDILFVVDQDHDYDEYYNDWEYVITQYDIDADGKDEIVIASRIKNGMSTPVGIFIYRIKDGKTWKLKAPQTWGDMTAKLVNNHVKVEPNHFGFTYDWAFENDVFVDHGEY